eukprot:2243048-Alexandrium_andersonii.AAC.1
MPFMLDADNATIALKLLPRACDLACLSFLEFSRRVLDRLASFPAKMLLFAKASHTKPCEHRQALAQEILDMRAGQDWVRGGRLGLVRGLEGSG